MAATFGAVVPAASLTRSRGHSVPEPSVVLMVKSAAPGGAGDIGQEVVLLAKELKAAHEDNRVDDLFAVRYSRLLSAVGRPFSRPRGPLLADVPLQHGRISSMERTGRIPDWEEIQFIVNDDGGAGVGLGMIADAVMSEVVSLIFTWRLWPKGRKILRGYLERGMKAAGSGKQ